MSDEHGRAVAAARKVISTHGDGWTELRAAFVSGWMARHERDNEPEVTADTVVRVWYGRRSVLAVPCDRDENESSVWLWTMANIGGHSRLPWRDLIARSDRWELLVPKGDG